MNRPILRYFKNVSTVNVFKSKLKGLGVPGVPIGYFGTLPYICLKLLVAAKPFQLATVLNNNTMFLLIEALWRLDNG